MVASSMTYNGESIHPPSSDVKFQYLTLVSSVRTLYSVRLTHSEASRRRFPHDDAPETLPGAFSVPDIAMIAYGVGETQASRLTHHELDIVYINLLVSVNESPFDATTASTRPKRRPTRTFVSTCALDLSLENIMFVPFGSLCVLCAAGVFVWHGDILLYCCQDPGLTPQDFFKSLLHRGLLTPLP